jgi:hypothetical protein
MAGPRSRRAWVTFEQLTRSLTREQARECAQRVIQSFARSAVGVNIHAFL